MSRFHDALPRCAELFVAAAVAPDGHLSAGEMRRIGDLLARRTGLHGDEQTVIDAIAEALRRLPNAADEVMQQAERAAVSLIDVLDAAERRSLLEDVVSVARADGIVLGSERRFITTLAQRLDVPPPDAHQPISPSDAQEEEWTALHDLTLIFLVLAHGADNELSRDEVQMMIRKLQEWQPELEESRVREILRSAMNRYAAGLDDGRIQEAITSVKQNMPAAQRMAALHDLIQIANADGVFLDVEEDLINSLQAEWEVEPYANYGRHGGKEEKSGT